MAGTARVTRNPSLVVVHAHFIGDRTWATLAAQDAGMPEYRDKPALVLTYSFLSLFPPPRKKGIRDCAMSSEMLVLLRWANSCNFIFTIDEKATCRCEGSSLTPVSFPFRHQVLK